MPKPSKKDQDLQARWEQRIMRAKKVRKKWRDLFRVELIRDYLDGKQKDMSYADEDWITINNMYSHMKAQLPALYSADPYFYVKLARSYKPNPMMIALWEKRGDIRAAYLNYLKRELKLKPKIRLSIQDAMNSYGVAKIRHHSQLKENPDFGSTLSGDDGSELIGDDGAPLMEPEYIPVNSRYIVERIHPDDILWDEDAGPIEDSWGWIAQRIRMTLDEAKNNPKYRRHALKLLEGRGAETEDDESRARQERKKGSDVKGRGDAPEKKNSPVKEPEIVIFWEIYSLKTKKWLTIAENGEIPIMSPENLPPGVEKHPFAFLVFTHRDDSPYPHPPLSPLLEPCKEYNRARSDIQKHRKRFNRKYAASRQAIGDRTEELSKFESGDDGTVIIVQGDARSAIAPIQDAQADPTRYQELGYLKAELVELAGHNSSESMGLATADSATQSALLDKRLEMKEGDAMSMVIDFTLDIARKLDMLVQTHIDRDEAVKINGPQGEFWEIVREQDYEAVEGEFEYTVNVGSTTPRMPHVERASWMAFLSLLASFPHLATSKRLLVKMAEMHHIEDEAMINELFEIANKILSGIAPMPGQSGSQAGMPEERPVSSQGGTAGGVKSLSQGSAAIGG